MGLIRSLLMLPVKGPMDGALWVTGQIMGAADREMNDPGTLRKLLQSLEKDLIAGRITEEEYDEAETQILMRLRGQP